MASLRKKDTLDTAIASLYHTICPQTISMRLPTTFSSREKPKMVKLSQNGCAVTYSGNSTELRQSSMVFTREEAVLIRADQPVPLGCGIYYFEVTLLNPGANGVCSLGYATIQAPSNKMLGYDKNSFGYQNNGYLSHDSVVQSRKNQLSFGEGKTVGIGIDFINNGLFFTFDGELKGTDFQNKIALSDNPKFYPAISIQSRNLKLFANLGQKPFKFDLKEHIAKARESQEKKILDRVNDESFTVNKMNQLVAKYLVHHGYVSSAKAFVKSTQQNEDIPGFGTMVERKRIKSLCQARLYGRVNTLLSEMFPVVVEKSPELMIQLRCRQLIEMMNRPESSSNRRKTRRNSSSSALLEKSKQLEEDLVSNIKEEDSFCQKYSNKKGIQVNGEEREENPMLKQVRFCRALVSYFEEVREKLGKVSLETSHLLEQTISLLAYPKPDSPDCPFKNLLDPLWDSATASLVNSAILATEHDALPSAAIDKCTTQLCELFNNKSFQPAQILGQFMLYHLDPSKLGELTSLTAKKRTKTRSQRTTRATTLKKRKKSQLEEECGLHLECDSSEKEDDEDDDEDGEEIEHDDDDFDDDGSGQAPPPPPPPEEDQHPPEDNSHFSSPEHRSTGVQSSSTSSNYRHRSNIYRFQSAQDSSDEDTYDRTLILARLHFPSLPISPEIASPLVSTPEMSPRRPSRSHFESYWRVRR